uniref:NADH dehydrogenase subunit 2 n=1 Tax=Chironomus nipponensis TaxID=586675 RepID=UPI001FAFE434|nr:NADH dehydrogenase subunit 2 [Chironomus nipponensis]UKO31630.1 NADH dehydrogenase subunit 2 [Chironomus nipponensis]UZS77077.1 NADH dehydrogenase subunit 2 [Chironomus nipponensis]
MLKNSYKMLFLSTLFLGTMISICSSSWFSVWMGLEINLLSFIPLTMKLNNLFSSEASLKYFLTQALASSMLLFSIILFSFLIEWKMMTNFNSKINIILASSLMMKTGMAPFHFWFPIVMEGLNWINNIILMTWQKIAPIILLSFCLNNYFFYFAIIMSVTFGSFGGLNQTSLRKLMAFSSINHLGWMVAGILNNQNIWKIYFIFYCFLSIVIIFLFNSLKIFNLNQIFSSFNFKFLMKTVIFIPLLSLGGLPPFLGFFPKWLVIDLLMNLNMFFLLILMINLTLITLYFYLRISYSAFLLNHNEMNWNFTYYFNSKKKLIFSFFLFISIFGLLFINLFFIFI